MWSPWEEIEHTVEFNAKSFEATYRSYYGSTVTITGQRFTRRIYRPNDGGVDILLTQQKGVETYQKEYDLWADAIFTPEALNMAIGIELGEPPSTEMLWDDRASNPQWTWYRDVTPAVVKYVEDQGFWLTSAPPRGRVAPSKPLGFRFTGTECFGQVFIERAWPGHIAPPEPVYEEACVFCKGDEAMHRGIGLLCGHKSHTECLYQDLWENPGLQCPECDTAVSYQG